MSPLYIVFRLNNVHDDFYEQYFNTSYWYDYYLKSVANFERVTIRMNITTADFYNMPVPCPCDDEQQK